MKANILMMSAVMMVFAAACSVEETPTGSALAQKQITLQAVAGEMPTDDATRSIRLDNGDIWWTPGDQISVFYGSGADGGSCFTAQIDENKKVANFTGTIGVITGGGDISVDQTFFWGLYPYNDTAVCDGTTIVTDVPDCQTAVAGTFAPGVYPWIGRSQGLLMSFYGLCGGIKFSVNKEGIKKATLKTADGSPIAGRVRIALDANGIPSVQEIIDGKDEVVLEAPDGEYFIPGKYYFFVTLPHNFNTSFFTVKFETFTEEGTYERKRALEIKRADFIAFGSALDGSVTYEKKTGAIPVEDAAFKAYLVENFDTDGDGEISYEEAAAITRIGIPGIDGDILSIQGVEFCTNLVDLGCSSQKIKKIDLSNNLALKRLTLYSNQLKTLDLSNNTALTELRCAYNQLSNLNLKNNKLLTTLQCDDNELTELDLSQNVLLNYLDCGKNKLTKLNLKNNTALTSLFCSHNLLTKLDISNNSLLKLFSCGSNLLTHLDLTNNLFLNEISCSSNQLQELDLTNNTELKNLSCSMNQITELDLSNNAQLESIGCFNNKLSSLNLANHINLSHLHCSGNLLETLDISNNPKLINLYCHDNLLTNLDLSNNSSLETLHCSRNKLSNLNVSHCSYLNNVYFAPMNDQSGNNLLQTLYITEGQVIPYINDGNRSDERIPASTAILIAPTTGGGEGSSETPEEP